MATRNLKVGDTVAINLKRALGGPDVMRHGRVYYQRKRYGFIPTVSAELVDGRLVTVAREHCTYVRQRKNPR